MGRWCHPGLHVSAVPDGASVPSPGWVARIRPGPQGAVGDLARAPAHPLAVVPSRGGCDAGASLNFPARAADAWPHRFPVHCWGTI